MACNTPSSSSWLNRSPPVATGCASLKRHFFLFSTSSKSITNTVFSYSYGRTHSTRCSYSRRWLNPLRRKPLDQKPSPEIVRHWIDADPLPLVSQERFRIASYNILGDKNAFKHRDLYSNVPLEYIKWSHRKRLICQELFGLSPDIICMQEVDRYFDLFNVMEKAGYVGSYKRRTGDNVDGCAMFWKADSFRLLEEVSIEFKEFGLRDNVALISVFETCRAKSRRLVVCNIHVLYNPNRGEVKLGQICLLSSRAQLISEKWGNVPVVLAGDFNCTPKSAIYKFLSSSELDIKLYNRRELSGQKTCHPSQVFGVKKETSNPLALIDRFLQSGWTDEEIKIATRNAECHLAVHPLKLNSSYASVKGSTKTRDSNGEPLATSYHSKFFGTVDYLWYSSGLVPTRVLDTLPVDILRRTGGLPCKKLGSDHLALVSEFAFLEGTADDNHGNNTTVDNHHGNNTTISTGGDVHTLLGELKREDANSHGPALVN
ncbi:carbon catabolite repressor protein 4 homolog 3 [Pistacia vera]|uniref:carbon catabolite repressor protein 4 homolog 3 n=1 Tax=Pistacia vera TaxID=55513 RepID=UPI0012630439|nr:carbon catabolite repressor protein 4 homolog 3 [Pistacia vera]